MEENLASALKANGSIAGKVLCSMAGGKMLCSKVWNLKVVFLGGNPAMILMCVC